jgi:uncharacterized protein (DUF2235 family)
MRPIRFIGVWDTVGTRGIPATGLRSAKLIHRRWEFHDTELSSHVDAAFHALAIDEARGPFTPTLWKTQQEAAEDQRVEQVWFSGVHGDIGGGSPESSLSDICLLWMVDRARSCGLAFDDDELKEATANRDPLGTLHDSRTKLYKLTRPKPRTIGDPKFSPQSLASSAVQRTEQNPSYAPEKLLEYLKGPNPQITDVT